MAKKFKLGSGLESLIPQKKTKPDEEGIRKDAVFYVEIEKIKSNPYQPRKEFDPEALKALSESIKQHGILQPLIVSRVERRIEGQITTEYQLIAGERRLMAAKLAGFRQVPVIIREPKNEEKLVLSLIENVQREDLNPIERAEAYKKLRDEFSFRQADIARLVGKSKEAISNTLRLLQLPTKIKEGLRRGFIQEGHARALLTVKNKELLQKIYNKIAKENLSVREAERLCYKTEEWRLDTKEKNQAANFLKKLVGNVEKIPGVLKIKFRKSGGHPVISLYFESEAKAKEFFRKFN